MIIIILIKIFHFRSFFRDLKSLQYLNVSNNVLEYLGVDECSSSKKSLKTIDFSANQLNSITLNSTSFFKFLTAEKLYLSRNNITSFLTDWEFLDKSLRFLDLKFNEIEILAVSTTTLN